MPVASLSPLPSDLRVGMSRSQVKHRLGLPDQVRMITEESRDLMVPEGEIETTLSSSHLRASDTRKASPVLVEVGEVWLYRDYTWNGERKGEWSVFGSDRWGSWDVYFDNSGRLRAWKFVEPSPSETTARNAVWLNVPPRPERAN